MSDIQEEMKRIYKKAIEKDLERNYVYAFTDSFEYGKETKVILEIEEKDGSFNNI